MAGIEMRVGDTGPALVATLTDALRRPVDLTGATVHVVVRDAATGDQQWSGDAAVDADQTTNTGLIRYPWAASDTAAIGVGDWTVDFVATFADGTLQTYPTSAGIPLSIYSGLPPSTYEALVVDPDTVARKVGIPLPMDEDTRQEVVEAILNAQAEVEGYLRRCIVPTTTTESLNATMFPGGYSGNLYTATAPQDRDWPVSNDPVRSIDAVTDDPNNDGYSLVTYTHGYDAKNDPAHANTRRYVLFAATATVRADNPKYARLRSMSVEGQSVSFDVPYGSAVRWSEGQAGTPPTLKSLSRHRKRGLFSRPRLQSGYGASYGLYGEGMGILVGPEGYGFYSGDATVLTGGF